MPRRMAYAALGLAAGFSGLALITSILTGTALLVTLAVTATVAVAVVVAVARKAPRSVAREAGRVMVAGFLVGFVATVCYDASRTVLSILDPSPFNPFGAFKAFGAGLLGPGASETAMLVAGTGVHFLNGTTFGGMYAALVGRRAQSPATALVAGMAWGVMLELFQSILYPGWLGITTVLAEFLFISSAGHLVYGAVLGLGVRRVLMRGGHPGSPSPEAPPHA